MAVYFITAGDQVKIGFSKNPKDRARAYQTTSPVPVTLAGVIEDGDEMLESILHQRFYENRTHGEWFNLTDEISELIAEHPCEDSYKNSWTEERRKKQSDLAKQLAIEGKFGGSGKGQGRKKKSKSSLNCPWKDRYKKLNNQYV